MPDRELMNRFELATDQLSKKFPEHGVIALIAKPVGKTMEIMMVSDGPGTVWNILMLRAALAQEEAKLEAAPTTH